MYVANFEYGPKAEVSTLISFSQAIDAVEAMSLILQPGVGAISQAERLERVAKRIRESDAAARRHARRSMKVMER